MVLGVAGKYCAGKDTAVRILKEAGFQEIDVDKIGHLVLVEMKGKVLSQFGSQILDPEGNIDRRKLGEIVFRSRKQRRRLESIVHPAMVRRVREEIRAKDRRIVINAALLFKMELHKLCDRIICVQAPFLLRLVRAARRDPHSLSSIWRRMRSQRGICPKFPPRDVDIYRVSNRSSIEALRRRLMPYLRDR
jgi:dephospho-CoA kinase